jgi:hypothetical protein
MYSGRSTLSCICHECVPSCYPHSMRATSSHAARHRAPRTECFHSPCCVDGHYGSRMFSLVCCPLYEMAMGNGGTMTISPSRRRDGGSAITVYSFLLISHLRSLRFIPPAVFRFLVSCPCFMLSHAFVLSPLCFSDHNSVLTTFSFSFLYSSSWTAT